MRWGGAEAQEAGTRPTGNVGRRYQAEGRRGEMREPLRVQCERGDGGRSGDLLGHMRAGLAPSERYREPRKRRERARVSGVDSQLAKGNGTVERERV